MVTHGQPMHAGPIVAILLALAASCSFDDGHPPVARASATPMAIPENDGFQTAVTLDASASADPVDDPEGLLGLDYEWRLSGDEFRFESGNDTAVSPVVRFRGDRPPTIELTVTDAEGQRATTQFQLQLSVTL